MNIKRRKRITYNAFVKAIREITEEGQSPSVRTIRSRIGGSNSTLLQYLQRWEKEINQGIPFNEGTPELLKQSRLLENISVLQTDQSRLNEALIQEKELMKEFCDLLTELQDQIANLKVQYQAEVRSISRKIYYLEKKQMLLGNVLIFYYSISKKILGFEQKLKYIKITWTL